MGKGIQKQKVKRGISFSALLLSLHLSLLMTLQAVSPFHPAWAAAPSDEGWTTEPPASASTPVEKSGERKMLPSPKKKKPAKGMTLARHGILLGGLSAFTVASVLLPRPSSPKIIGGFAFDTPIQEAIQAKDGTSQDAFSLATDIGQWAEAGLLFGSYALVPAVWKSARTRGYVARFFIGAEAVLANHLTTWFIKNITARQRPIGAHGNDSFPSGHTSAAFTLGLLFFTPASPFPGPELKGLRIGFGVTSVVAATAIGIGRMAAGRHYFSDVLVGALIGTFWGVGYPFLVKNVEETTGAKMSFTPYQEREETPYPTGLRVNLAWEMR